MEDKDPIDFSSYKEMESAEGMERELNALIDKRIKEIYRKRQGVTISFTDGSAIFLESVGRWLVGIELADDKFLSKLR